MHLIYQGGVQGENNLRLFQYSMPRSGILEPWLSGTEGATTLAPKVRVIPLKGRIIRKP
jgi:hypothetical protein